MNEFKRGGGHYIAVHAGVDLVGCIGGNRGIQCRDPTGSNAGIPRAPTQGSHGLQRRDPTGSNAGIPRAPMQGSHGLQCTQGSNAGIPWALMHTGIPQAQKHTGITQTNVQALIQGLHTHLYKLHCNSALSLAETTL